MRRPDSRDRADRVGDCIHARALEVTRDALFECVSALSAVCSGPVDPCGKSPLDALAHSLDVLRATDRYDGSDRSVDIWRGDAVLRLAALRSLR